MDDTKQTETKDNKARNLNISGYDEHKEILRREAERLSKLWRRPVSASQAARYIFEFHKKQGGK